MKKILVLGLIILTAFPFLCQANGTKEYQITELLPIADFESETPEQLSKEKWRPYSDEGIGGKSKIGIQTSAPGYAGSKHCLHVTWKMDLNLKVIYAGIMLILNTEEKGIDLTAYHGIRFIAKGRGKLNVHLGVPGGKKEFNYPRTSDFSLYPEWQVYEIPFSQFKVRWGTTYKWDLANVLYTEWENDYNEPREGEVFIDDISFYKVKEIDRQTNNTGENTATTKDLQSEPVVSQLKTEQLKGKRVAVVGVESLDIDKKISKAMIDFIINAFVNDGSLKVVDRNSIEKILDEQAFQSNDFSDTEKMIKVGKIAGADFISIGSISKVGNTYYLNVKLISVQTAEITGSSIATSDNDSGFFMMTNEAINKLFKK